MTKEETEKACKDQERFNKLVRLAGSFHGNEFQTISISGDDATQTWHIHAGKQHWWGNSIKGAIDKIEIDS